MLQHPAITATVLLVDKNYINNRVLVNLPNVKKSLKITLKNKVLRSTLQYDIFLLRDKAQLCLLQQSYHCHQNHSSWSNRLNEAKLLKNNHRSWASVSLIYTDLILPKSSLGTLIVSDTCIPWAMGCFIIYSCYISAGGSSGAVHCEPSQWKRYMSKSSWVSAISCSALTKL